MTNDEHTGRLHFVVSMHPKLVCDFHKRNTSNCHSGTCTRDLHRPCIGNILSRPDWCHMQEIARDRYQEVKD